MPKREDVAPEEGKTIKKNAFEKSFLKYLEGIDSELPNKIHELKCVKVAEPNMPKIDMAFAVFSGNGKEDEEPNEAENIEIIKNILFHYHTAPDKEVTRPVYLQVLEKEDEDTPYILSYQEYMDE